MTLPANVRETLALANKAADLLLSHRGLGSKTSFSGEELIECIRQSDIAELFDFKKYDDAHNTLFSKTYRWSILECNMMFFHVEILNRRTSYPFMVGSKAALSCGRLRPIDGKNITIPQVIATLRELFAYMESQEQVQLQLEQRIKNCFADSGFPFSIIVNKKGYLLSVKMPYKMKTIFQLSNSFTDDDVCSALEKSRVIRDALLSTRHIQLKGYGNNEMWIEPEQ